MKIRALILCLAIGSGTAAWAQNARATADAKTMDAIDCSGTADECVKPAKFLSKTPECVCFTCGYGTKGSKAVCTRSVKEARSLAKITERSGFADETMTAAVAALADKDRTYDAQDQLKQKHSQDKYAK